MLKVKNPNNLTTINLTCFLVLRYKHLLIYICTLYVSNFYPPGCLSLGKIYVSQNFCFVLCGFIVFSFTLLGVSFILYKSQLGIPCNKQCFLDMLSKL